MGRQDGGTRQVSQPSVDSSTAGILHIDMDAFFAAVELLDHPELRGKPAIVGRATGRSVVTSATYEARKFGIRSAMPVVQAVRLCPRVIILEPHFERYRFYSTQVMEIFQRVTPLVEPLSIDEAFLDVRGATRLLGPPAVIGEMIRHRVRAETGLVCSVGAAATKFVAKLASGRAKPDGMLVIPAAQTLAFLRPLPVGALWGVGASTQEELARLGLRSVADLADTPLAVLQRRLGEASGRKLHDLANGIDPREVSTRNREKSVGHEVTFEHDVTDDGTLQRELLRLADQTGARLRRRNLVGRTVSLKLRYADFRTITRSRTLPEPTNVGRRIFHEVLAAYHSVAADRQRVRLIGVRMEQLEAAGGGPVGLWDPDEDWREAELAVDEASARFGAGILGPASLLSRKLPVVGDTSSASDLFTDRGAE